MPATVHTDDVDDTKARRIHSVLEQIRSHDVTGDDRRSSVLDELRSFANTVNGLDLPTTITTSSAQQDHHQLSYGDRVMQTRADLKLLEQLVSQTFHWSPHHQSALSQSTGSRTVREQPRQLDPVSLQIYMQY